MSLATLLVLRVMLEDPTDKHYGLAISNQVRLKSGTVYPILARLERAGWVSSYWENIDPVVEGRRPRRYYRLTGLGLQRAHQALEDAQQLIFNASRAPGVPLIDQGLT